jgi:hypothetical protein
MEVSFMGRKPAKNFVRCTISKKRIDPFLIRTFSTSIGFNHRVLLNFTISDDAIYQHSIETHGCTMCVCVYVNRIRTRTTQGRWTWEYLEKLSIIVNPCNWCSNWIIGNFIIKYGNLTRIDTLWKECLISDGQQFNQY